MNARNMIAGIQLAERHVEQTPPSSSASKPLRIAWHEVGFPVRIVAKLRAAIDARAPVGYEDETGFHSGADATDWSSQI